jgi:MFS family permease
MLFLGIAPALVVFYVLRNVAEPPRFERQPFTLPRIFAPHIARTTLFATLLAIGVQSGYYALFAWMPEYLTSQRHLAPLTGGSYLYLLIAGAFAGYIGAGYVNDALGRRRTFIIFSACSAILVPLYLYLVVANWQLLIAGPALGFFASGIFSGFGPYFSELFPGTMRGAAQGFCYNVGRGVAGFGPYVVGVLAAHYPIGTAMSAVAIIAYASAILAVLFLPETRGMQLR